MAHFKTRFPWHTLKTIGCTESQLIRAGPLVVLDAGCGGLFLMVNVITSYIYLWDNVWDINGIIWLLINRYGG